MMARLCCAVVMAETSQNIIYLILFILKYRLLYKQTLYEINIPKEVFEHMPIFLYIQQLDPLSLFTQLGKISAIKTIFYDTMQCYKYRRTVNTIKFLLKLSDFNQSDLIIIKIIKI